MSYEHINLNFHVFQEHLISPHVPKTFCLLIFIYEFQYAMQGFVYDM